MPYNRLAFYSYKRGAGGDIWHKETCKALEGYLQTALGRHKIPLFFDRRIPDGSIWKRELKLGLNRSPVLIAFFSMAYFRSDFCMAEFETFRKREKELDLPPGSLIHTATVWDPEHYPGWATDTNFAQYQDYYNSHPSFWTSDKGIEFSDALKDFAMAAAAKIRARPKHSETFPELDLSEAATDEDEDDFSEPENYVPQPYSEAA